jgi:hypothetical protein
MVVVGNLSGTPDKATVDLSALVAVGDFTAVDVLGREPVTFANGRSEIELPPWRAVALIPRHVSGFASKTVSCECWRADRF